MSRLRFLNWLCVLPLLLGTSCGPPAGKVWVEGDVTWNDQPLTHGHVMFFTAPLVPAGAGPVENGHYRFLSLPGKMSVQITSSREGKFDKSEQTNIREQYLPAKYNTESELSAEVSLEGANEFNFALTGAGKGDESHYAE